jgi:hypothetical protein
VQSVAGAERRPHLVLGHPVLHCMRKGQQAPSLKHSAALLALKTGQLALAFSDACGGTRVR